MNNAKKVTFIALALAAIGSFMSWASIQSVFGEITVSGTTGDGKVTLVLAGIAALVCYKAQKRTGLIWCAVACVAAIATCAGNIINITSMSDEEFAIVQVGLGLYLCLAAFVAAFFGFCVQIRHHTNVDQHAMYVNHMMAAGYSAEEAQTWARPTTEA